MSQEIGLFYGSTTGMTEDVAFRLQDLGNSMGLDLTAINIVDLADPHDMFAYEKLIIGTPTWNYGEHQDDWELVINQIADADLAGKKIALFGLGDQIGYPEYYLDAMGMLAAQFKAQGADLIGSWSAEGYKFTTSKALLPDGKNFVGLALDEDTQPELTDARMEKWLKMVVEQFGA